MTENDWRQTVVDRQREHTPKERSETYYHPDGLDGGVQMWVKHSPGMNIPVRVEKVWTDGITERDDYDSHLQLNLGSEVQAYRLYKALESFFNDEREAPWFFQDND